MSWWESDEDDPEGWRAAVARPAILLAISLVLGSGALALVGGSAHNLITGFAARHAPVCGSHATNTHGCLVPQGLRTMNGRVGHLTFEQIWTVSPTHGPSQVVDLTAVESHNLNRAKTEGPVTGLFWHGDLVAFRTMNGRQIDSSNLGLESAVGPLLWALSTSAFALGAWLSALARRRAGVGWWQRRVRVPDTVSSWAYFLCFALGIGGLVISIPDSIGVPGWVEAGLIVVVGGFIVIETVRIARRESTSPAGRHVRAANSLAPGS